MLPNGAYRSVSGKRGHKSFLKCGPGVTRFTRHHAIHPNLHTHTCIPYPPPPLPPPLQTTKIHVQTNTHTHTGTRVLINHFHLEGKLSPQELEEGWHEHLNELRPHAKPLPGVDRLTAHLHAHSIPMVCGVNAFLVCVCVCFACVRVCVLWVCACLSVCLYVCVCVCVGRMARTLERTAPSRETFAWGGQTDHTPGRTQHPHGVGCKRVPCVCVCVFCVCACVRVVGVCMSVCVSICLCVCVCVCVCWTDGTNT